MIRINRGCNGLKCITRTQIDPVMNYLSGNLILRYLTEQCSNDEIKEIDRWLGESSQNQNTFNYLKMMISNLN